MGKHTGFLEVKRRLPNVRKPEERVQDFKEHYAPFGEEAKSQASRCMDCGVPFCNSGCPLGNRIPEFNDAVYRGDFSEAYNVLRTTNNFPEFTGRICPAPCEASCVLGINNEPVTIEHIEKEIAEVAGIGAGSPPNCRRRAPANPWPSLVLGQLVWRLPIN